jgi:hypothetical protein
MDISKLSFTFSFYVIVFFALLTLLFYTERDNEGFSNPNFDDKEDNGLPLSLISNIGVPSRLYYKEIEPESFVAMLKELATIKVENTIKTKLSTIIELNALDDKQLRDEIVNPVISHLNKNLPKYDTYTPHILYYIANFKVIKRERLTQDTYFITSRFLVHRESKQYGFVVYCKSIVGSDSILKGLVSLNVTGFIPEEKIKTYLGIDDGVIHPRSYDVSLLDFQNDEEIMKTKQYEDSIIKKQMEGLMLDLGISATSFG